MSLCVMPLKIDLSIELNDDEKKKEVVGLIFELEQSLISCYETLTDVKTLLK